MQRPFAFLLLFVLSLFAPFALPAAAQPTIDPILPENGRFQLTSRELEVGTVSSNFDFSLTPIALNTAVYPANYNFEAGSTGWTVSSPTNVVVQQDSESLDGSYLWFKTPYQWAQSSSFTVPVEAQSIRFSYWAWTDQDAKRNVPLLVSVLSGENFSTQTDLPIVLGSQLQGWQTAILDLQLYQGQTIKLQFQAERWGDNAAQARVDNIALYTEIPGWIPSNTNQVVFEADDPNRSDGHVLLKSPYHFVRSSTITVPTDAQSIHFAYMAWASRNAREMVPLHVSVLSGTNFATETYLPNVSGSHIEGWKPAILDIQAFRGQTIQIKFQAERWGDRAAQARVDNLSFYSDTPGWSISNAALVSFRDTMPPPEGELILPNADFNQIATTIDSGLTADELSFSAAAQQIDTAFYPTNANFTAGALTGWTVSDSMQVVAQQDSEGIDGGYLWLKAPYQWARSSSFTIPTNTQGLQFQYIAWTTRNATEVVPVHVTVLSGANFATRTDLPVVQGSHVKGWQQAELDLQAFRGKTIKLQFQAERWGDRAAQVRIDTLKLVTDTPNWTPSDVSQVELSSAAPPSFSGTYIPANADFSSGPVAVTSSPALLNGMFSTGTLDGWTSSDNTNVTVENDSASQDGAYLWLRAPYASATSSSFSVPVEAQSVHFIYTAWTARNANETVPLYATVLSGSQFEIRTQLPTLLGNNAQGWKQAALDIQAFRGQTIKIEFQAERWGDRSAQARVDSVALYTDIPSWTPSDTNQANFYSTSTTSGYAWLKAPYASVRSPVFTVPTDAQSLQFDYTAWTAQDTQRQVPLHINVLSGVGFAVSTPLPNVIGSQNEGWKTATLDVSSFRGRTIQIQFQAERWGDNAAQAGIDNIRFVAGTQSPLTLRETNAGNVYMWLKGPYMSIRSRPFFVPMGVQSVHFDYVAWTPRNANEQVPLHVVALSGESLSVKTDVGIVQGSHNQGWQSAIVDLQTFQGQFIQLEFQTERWGDRSAQANIDSISFHTDVPGWTPSNANNVNIIPQQGSTAQGTLLLNAPYAAATSAPIEVPIDALNLSFDYAAWTPYNANEAVPLHVDVLSGPDFKTTTRLGSPIASQNQGMVTTTLNISSFRNRTIKLRFQAETWGDRSSRAKVDNISFTGSTSLAPLGWDTPYGNFLAIEGAGQWAASNSLVLTSTGRLRLDYLAWTPRNANEQVNVYVDVLSGPSFSTITTIKTLQSSGVKGWNENTLVDLSSFYGQTIMMRFRTDGWGDWQAHLRVANVFFEPMLFTAQGVGQASQPNAIPPSSSACTAYVIHEGQNPTQIITPQSTYFLRSLRQNNRIIAVDLDIATSGGSFLLAGTNLSVGGNISSNIQLPQGTVAEFTITGGPPGAAPVIEFCEMGAWKDLVSFRPSESTQRTLLCRAIQLSPVIYVEGAYVHRVEDALGDVNLDYYEVRFTPPSGFNTPAELLEHVRRDLNSYIDTSQNNFTPYSQYYGSDQVRFGDDSNWDSGSPMDAVISIQLSSFPAYERGSVVTSAYVLGQDHAYWRFSSIWIGGDYHHAVSGNREFGVKRINVNEWVFYTRGADRTTTPLHNAGSAFVWPGADALWQSMQREIVALIDTNAIITPRDSARYSWRTIAGTYWSPQTPWIPSSERC